jgi:hypothetical protein
VITSSYTSRPGLAVCFLGTSVVDLPHNLRILPSHFQFARSLPRQLQILQVSRPPGRFATAGRARDHQS